MNTDICLDVRRFVQETARLEMMTPPPLPLAQHVATCAVCRGALVALIAKLIDGASAPAAISCDECQADLPLYLEHETHAGANPALPQHLRVWWHLMTCPMCAETYQMTCALLNAEQAGTLSEPPLRRSTRLTQPRRLGTITLNRSFLNYALPMQSSLLGAMRGGENEDTTLIAEEAFGYYVTMSVQKQLDENWSVVMTISAPLQASLRLSLGDRTFRARFDELGRALVRNVPASLLGAHDGPDLIAAIEPE